MRWTNNKQHQAAQSSRGHQLRERNPFMTLSFGMPPPGVMKEARDERAGRDLPPKNTQRWTLRIFYGVESGLYLAATAGRCRTSAGLL